MERSLAPFDWLCDQETFPYLRTEETVPLSKNTPGKSVERLDLGTVLKVSQAVSGEMDPQRLIDVLMRTAIEQSGAERGFLVLTTGTELRIAAKATSADAAIVVDLCNEPVTTLALPETILHRVLTGRESVVLSNAASESAFCADPYLIRNQTRSILCAPLISQAYLVGALYLENGPAAGSFAPPTIAVLKLLASQAAITLENARLYRDLVEREAKIRRLVDANIVGIFIYSTDGLITEANEAFLRMLGYDREDLLAGQIRWADLTPPDWLQRDMELWEPMLERTGVLAPFEKEYFRKDGSRVPVLIGVANFDESSGEGVAFVLDLTEQKHAEAEARENEQRYRDVQTTLAHANRVTTMGQLAATISHEVKQPIAATVTNAEAGLRLLGRQPPRLQEARQAFERIIESAMSAGDVINRIRSVVRNSPPRKERVQLNAAIREVAAIMRGEAAKNHVSVRLHLGEDLPLVRGDRVQLQQVVMNLVLNAIEAMGVVDEFSRELTISTRKNMSGSAVVSVSDTGPGISSAVGEHLFEPFFTTKDAGMGIGLAICQSILDVHGGQLRVFANVPRGAVFEFVLPRSLDITPGLA